MASNNRNLRTILIEPFKQIKFGLYMIFLTTLFMVMSGALFIQAFVSQYEHVMSLFNVVDKQMRWDFVVNDVFYANIFKISVFYLLFMILLLVLIFTLTHRYYGPLVSIERFIEEMKSGNYSTRVNVRQKDELQELAGQLNSLAQVLEKKHGNQGNHKKETSPSGHP